ncbi:MAG: pseudouridine synthase [Patescibacteria group bacterium]|jgi:pseudouridine synthase
MTRVRINKFLSSNGICSRRSADEHIRAGKVKVNGIIAKLGDSIDPKIDKVVVNDKIIIATSKLEYYAFYKPRGVVATKSDELGRKSIADYIPDEKKLNPVGRLDMDSEGLIILTNDGELIQQLTHPSFKHEKEYYVEANMSESFKISDLNRLTKGINIKGTRMQAKSIDKIKIEKRKNMIKFNLVLTTGYNRQIRRMCDKIGLSVCTILRVRIGKLVLNEIGLRAGQLKSIDRDQMI